MDEGILQSIQNFSPNICGISKKKGNWLVKDELRGEKWLPIDQTHYSVRRYVKAIDKFRIDDFVEEGFYLG